MLNFVTSNYLAQVSFYNFSITHLIIGGPLLDLINAFLQHWHMVGVTACYSMYSNTRRWLAVYGKRTCLIVDEFHASWFTEYLFLEAALCLPEACGDDHPVLHSQLQDGPVVHVTSVSANGRAKPVNSAAPNLSVRPRHKEPETTAVIMIQQ